MGRGRVAGDQAILEPTPLNQRQTGPRKRHPVLILNGVTERTAFPSPRSPIGRARCLVPSSARYDPSNKSTPCSKWVVSPPAVRRDGLVGQRQPKRPRGPRQALHTSHGYLRAPQKACLLGGGINIVSSKPPDVTARPPSRSGRPELVHRIQGGQPWPGWPRPPRA